MPKKGIFLTTEAAKRIKGYLKKNNYSQEKFAEEILEISSKTFRNWLSGKHSVDFNALELILEELGIGIYDLLGDVDCDKYNYSTGVVSTIREIYQNNVAIYVENSYRKIVDLFQNHLTFLKFPKHGYFRTFKHEPEKGQNYYFEFHIKLMEEIEEAKFVISFTVDKIRINYGELHLNHDRVDVVQYFQPPNYSVKMASKNIIRVATWFDEVPHTFVINSQIPFEIEEKGKISECELKLTNDIRGSSFFGKKT
jgi:transcriptional regulator with XRE-family HTH domain